VGEREFRARLTQIVSQKVFIKAGIVKMVRRCGKVNCRCAQGEGHQSHYLSMREGTKRKMIYIPASMEKDVREWVKNYKGIQEAIDRISEYRLQQIRQG